MSKTSKSKLAQSQHAASAAHCTNHYTRSVMQLESVVEERLAQLSLLVQENAELKRREAALQSAVSSLAGSVSAATKAVLVSSSVDAADALHATFRPASPDVRFSISDYKGFLLRMQQREAAVQRIMSQLGHVESEELYSSWLLRRAFSSPQRAAQHLAMSKAERVAFVLGTVQKMGLLIGKYDLLHHPRTSSGTPREQLDALVDDLNERTLAFCLLAPPTRQLEMACLNMDTGQPEPYPQGWWAVVIDAMQLTENQKAALKICWDKVKPIKLALTAKYEALSTQLSQLQQKQLDQQRQFELQAEHAIVAVISRNAQREQQRQQKQQQQLAQQQEQHDVQLQAQLMQQQQQQWQQHQHQQYPMQQQYPQQQQWQACLQSPQQQQQQQVLPMQPLLERKASLVESLAQDQDLFQFCRALLGSELQGADGLPDSQGVKDSACFAPTATSAPPAALPANGMACGMQLDLSAAAPTPAAMAMIAQQQVYASRLAPLQQTQQQRQFMQFSPAVAAAAAASDQNLWLGGLSPTLGAPSPGSNGPHGLTTVPQSSDSLQDPSNGLDALEDSEGMLVDAATEQPSTSSTGAPLTSKSLEYTSDISKGVSSPTSASPSTDGVAAPAAGAVGATAAARGQAGGKDHEFWQQLAAGCVPGAAVQQADPDGAGGKPHMALQTTGHEERKLERRLDRITAQLKMQQYCMHTYVLNICSKKQMALKYINCYPWVPESFSMAEALDDMDW